MPAKKDASKKLAVVEVEGVLGYFIDGMFIRRVAGAEEGDEGEGEGEGEGGDEEEEEDDEEFDKERALATIRKLRGVEKASKAQAKELKKLQSALKAYEDKDKSEVEKLTGEAKTATEQLTAAQTRAQDLAVQLFVERAARKLGFIDEDDAYRLIDRKAIEFDDDGDLDTDQVESLLKDLAKAKPHLIRESGSGSGSGSSGGEGGEKKKSLPATGRPAKNGSAVDEAVKKSREQVASDARYRM